jgi:hypothetical protein
MLHQMMLKLGWDHRLDMDKEHNKIMEHKNIKVMAEVPENKDENTDARIKNVILEEDAK